MDRRADSAMRRTKQEFGCGSTTGESQHLASLGCHGYPLGLAAWSGYGRGAEGRSQQDGLEAPQEGRG